MIKTKYPRLYLISCQQNYLIQQMGDHKVTGWEWDFHWRRHLFDCEVSMADNFINEMTGVRVQLNCRDDWVWKPEPSGQYSAKSDYDMLRGVVVQGADVADFEQLWKLRIPSKAAIFVSRLLRDRLPTKANLNRRSTAEDTPHLFFQSSKILPLWWETTSWVNISTVFPKHQRQHFAQHMIDGVKGICISRWKVWWVALTWSVWQMRNNIIFSNGIFNGNKLMEDATFLFWTWLRNYEKDFVTNFNHWSSNLTEWGTTFTLQVTFMDLISNVHIQPHLKDTMRWLADPSGLYSSKSAYSLLTNVNRNLPHPNIYKSFWKLNIPPRAAVFAWRILKNRLPTRHNLFKRNVSIPDYTCPFCRSHQEEAGHLFFNCKATIALWWESMSWNRMVGPLAESPANHYIQFCEGFGDGKKQNHWRCWWIALTSSIWQHRNSMLFQGKSFEPLKVMEDALFLMWSWLKTRDKNFCQSFNFWSSNIVQFFVVLSDTMCPFCCNHEEDAAHLFFNCMTALPQNPRDHFLQHGHQLVGNTKSTRWKCWWVAVTWTIWQQRNKTVFQNQCFNSSKVMDDALLLLWSWLKSNDKDFTVHFNQWATNLTLGFCT
ncbi:putative ribonuclease H protein [Glycine max]|nr:putative ribonuclease H protein [Glycine max]